MGDFIPMTPSSAPHSFPEPYSTKATPEERIVPRDFATSGTLPGVTDININDTRVILSGRNRAFRVTDTSGSDIVTVGRSGSNYGLFLGSTNLYGAGSSGQILTSSGAGAAPTWQNTVIAPGGSNTQVQYNNGGTLAGSAGITLSSTQVTGMAFSDTTTGDVTVSAHGLVPKAPNDTAKFLRGDGTWAVNPSQVTLLKANSGSDTNTSAVNLDSYAISGLTELDTIKIFVEMSVDTQPLAGDVLIRQDTSGQTLLALFGGALAADAVGLAELSLNPMHGTLTEYHALGFSSQTNLAKNQAGTLNTGSVRMNSKNSLTAWTGSWTLALRSPGITAGGTVQWQWRVFKVAGQ